MFMKKVFTILFFFVFAFSSSACLNYYFSVDANGHLHPENDIRVGFNTNFNNALIESKLTVLLERLKKEKDYKVLSDYTVGIMKAGKHKEALEIFKVLYEHLPNDFQLASNLGTAYELNGDLKNALKYIKKGIELNPNDHDGSEWIHVEILKAKQKVSTDPDYLVQHSVLNLSEKQEKDSLVAHQISLQIRERFPFSPKKDLIMASLLIDLGDCYANTKSIEFAEAVYKIAKEYFGDNSNELNQKLKKIKELLKKHNGVEAEQSSLSEGNNIRLHKIESKELLDDNNPSNYQVNWTNLTTDPESLLNLVDLHLTKSYKKNNANTNEEVLNLDTENKTSVSDVESNQSSREKKKVIFFVLSCALVLLIGGYLVVKGIKNNN